MPVSAQVLDLLLWLSLTEGWQRCSWRSSEASQHRIRHDEFISRKKSVTILIYFNQLHVLLSYNIC